MSSPSEAAIGRVREAVKRQFWSSYWICPACRRSHAYDYEDDWCAGGCDVLLRRNDDVRIAITDALRRAPASRAK